MQALPGQAASPMLGFFRKMFAPKRRPGGRSYRGFDAAKVDHLLEGWSPDLGISSADIAAYLPLVRGRVREMSKNDSYVTRALQMFDNNVVGPTGIKLSMDVPGPDKKVDMDLSDKVEKAWRRWAENPAWCDAEGRKTLRKILSMAVRDWKREGEAIICIIPGGAHYGNPFGISLKRRRPDSLAIYKNGQTPSGNQIHNGVEIDGWGAPVAYHFYKTMSRGGVFSGDTVRVPANQVLHLFDEEYEGQTRGFPVFTPVVRELKMGHAYDEAELVAARVDAARCGTWEQQEGGDPADFADEDDEGFHQQVDPGEDRVAPIGWKFSPNTPSRPNGGYGTFKSHVVRRVASGLSLSYNVLANDLEGVNYSSIRAGTLEDRETYKTLQAAVVETVLRPLFRRRGGWLDCAFLAGALDIGFDRLEDVREADSWKPRSWPWVDPGSETAALKTNIDLGIETRSDACDEQGRDYYDNLSTIAQEREWEKKTGVSRDGQDQAQHD